MVIFSVTFFVYLFTEYRNCNCNCNCKHSVDCPNHHHHHHSPNHPSTQHVLTACSHKKNTQPKIIIPRVLWAHLQAVMRRAACRLAVYLALYGAVVLVSLTGDCLLRLARPTAPVLQYGIAASDSTVHGLIGGLSWAMLAVLQLTELATLPSSLSSLSSLSSSSLSFSPTPSPSPSAAYKSAQPVSSAVREYLSVAALRDTLLCALLSAAIDLDHLLAARSFSIQVSTCGISTCVWNRTFNLSTTPSHHFSNDVLIFLFFSV